MLILLTTGENALSDLKTGYLQEKEKGLVEHIEGLSKSATSSIVLLWKHPTLGGKEKKKGFSGPQRSLGIARSMMWVGVEGPP